MTPLALAFFNILLFLISHALSSMTVFHLLRAIPVIGQMAVFSVHTYTWTELNTIIIFILLLIICATSMYSCTVYSVLYLATGLFFHKLNSTVGYYLHTQNNGLINFSLTFILFFMLLFLRCDFYYLFSICLRLLLLFVYFTYVPILPHWIIIIIIIMLLWGVTQRWLVVSHGCFGTAYRSHLHGSSSTIVVVVAVVVVVVVVISGFVAPL